MHLRAAYAHLRRRSNQAFVSFGMSSDQYVLLAVLAQYGKATQQELVRYCYSGTATMGTMLSLLEAKGLIRRTPHPEDGRARSVRLSRAGDRLAEMMRRSSSSLRTELTTLFSDDELHKLLEFLQRLAGAMRPPVRRSPASGSPRLKSPPK